MAETKEISSDELAVYDRQIRLWGLDAQNRLRNSSALIYGMTPLGAEIGKNLMLCGLNALTVADGCLVGENDANFLIDVKKDVGKNVCFLYYIQSRKSVWTKIFVIVYLIIKFLPFTF
uniref:THIF-type NAD/FAD binding fold domain-containing protein n=1 Tax=Panagrolaimus davidi TaxID=227884 RepID=A0A914QLQ4_9BILA